MTPRANETMGCRSRHYVAGLGSASRVVLTLTSDVQSSAMQGPLRQPQHRGQESSVRAMLLISAASIFQRELLVNAHKQAHVQCIPVRRDVQVSGQVCQEGLADDDVVGRRVVVQLLVPLLHHAALHVVTMKAVESFRRDPRVAGHA